MATVNRTMTATEQLPLSRAEQRKQRLLELESEQAAEEAEALKMTEEQRRTLFQPFAAVKAEFSDLDGLRWTQAALRMLQPRQRHVQPLTPGHHKIKSSTFVVLTPADLALFKPEDTIRVSPTAKSRTPFAGDTTGSTTATTRSRSRSPVKGLFPPSKPPSDLSNPFDPHRPGLGDDIASSLNRNRPLPLLPDNVHGPPGLTPLPSYQSTFEDYHVSPFPSSPPAPSGDAFTEGFSLLDDLRPSPILIPPSTQVQPNSAHRARLQAILGNGSGVAVASPEVLSPFLHPHSLDPFSLSYPTPMVNTSDIPRSIYGGEMQSPPLSADYPLDPTATFRVTRHGGAYDFGDDMDMEIDVDAEATPMPSPTLRRSVPLSSPPLMYFAVL